MTCVYIYNVSSTSLKEKKLFYECRKINLIGMRHFRSADETKTHRYQLTFCHVDMLVGPYFFRRFNGCFFTLHLKIYIFLGIYMQL